ncbi:RagB/SusD family nutrient uptake outer membrane protein [uncultured Polaribacter sp.]|uniref:RagB/SusD family nutrient uptake outer membrane protein n=1 Tax=uncultured Polaribacter sp. TaxID=174711 RepID=UPI00262CDE84|nr:RagB/SusD family nutrient uptake outer membrane protein [uncultured Polaribacter sp.]
MKFLKKWHFYTKVFFYILLLSSCEAFVEIDAPNDQLTGDEIYQEAGTVTAALTNIYAHLRDDGITNGRLNGMNNLLGLYADELDLHSTSLPQIQSFYLSSLEASNTNVSNLWKNSYNLIYAANAIIEGLEKTSELKAQEKKQFLGEAYFVRGFLHFYLVNLFGDIPYIDTTDYKTNSKVSRMPFEEVYTNIIADLVQSKSLLTEKYTSSEKVRPNKWAASALLARVYLYHKDWQKALEESTAIINSGSYQLEPNINKVFLKTSPETLWQFSTAANGYNTYEGFTFIFNSGPPRTVALSNRLIQSFNFTDGRLANWTKAISKGSNSWYHPYKYKEQKPTSTSKEYSIMFRLAEQFLIRAEARVKLGDVSGAVQDLNTIRIRAGLIATTATDQEAVFNAILQERRHELFTELGHRWFDLKRTGKASSYLPLIKSNWKSTAILLPIPTSELILNPNLNPQNNGY